MSDQLIGKNLSIFSIIFSLSSNLISTNNFFIISQGMAL